MFRTTKAAANIKVNSYTQWGKLRTIMVGDASNACYQPRNQPAQIPKVNSTSLETWPIGKKPLESIELANAQLDNLASILSNDLKINVIRPNPIDHSQSIATPFFESEHQYCCVCPRDTLITVGNIMMEASMSRRDRYFEFENYRNVVQTLWKNDKNALWKSAPKPSMSDEMYNLKWTSFSEEEKLNEIHNNRDVSFVLRADAEVVFDAADLTKTGKHLFGQVGTTVNMNAIKWLRRELYEYGYYVHPLRFYNDT
eukprot:223988_1